VAQARGPAPATGQVIRKMVASMALAAGGEARSVTRHSNALTSVLADPGRDRPPVGGGYLELAYASVLEDVCPGLGENTQTIVHFGIDDARLRSFASQLPPFCVTRIVPMGQALDFDVIWDGYDLSAELTQLLRVR